MNVAAYHPWVYLKGGAERTLLELIRRSRHRWTLFTNHYDPEGTFPEFRDVNVVELRKVSVKRSLVNVGAAVLQVMLQQIPTEGIDAVMVSSEGLGNLVPFRCREVPVFCFCHTPLKVVYDPFTRARYFAQSPSPITRLAIQMYTRVDRFGWQYYRRIFCNSQEVASRVLSAQLTRPELVEVLYPGVDLQRFDHQGPRDPFFLLPGRIARTKNIELGIDAFLQFKQMGNEGQRFRLVIAGMVDQKSRPYLHEMQQRAAGCSDIDFVISPTDQELRDLYRRCFATLFTALNEDWGIVALEAMASGKPVIAVNRGGPTESVIHEETGFLCPADSGAFAPEMANLVADPDRAFAMGMAGRQRAAAFTWEPFVRRIDDYVDSLARDPEMAVASR